MHQSWLDGDILCRWAPHLIHGHGYPIFNFYPPLFSYAASFAMFFFPAVLAFNLTVSLFYFLSGLSMYIFARKLWGRSGGLISAIAYLFAPYHILDLYVRGAAAELTVFVFFPLILWSIYCLSQRLSLRPLIVGFFSSAGLFLSHNISALIFFPVAFLYLIFAVMTSEDKSIKKIVAGLSVFMGGFLLAAYFIIPALVEKRFVHIERVLIGLRDYRRYFVDVGQLFHLSWRGFAGVIGQGHGMYFTLGFAHLLLAIGALIFLKKVAASFKGAGAQILFFFIFLLVSLFFTLRISSFFWRTLPMLSFVQFPWRFLMCATTAISILCGGVVPSFNRKLRLYLVPITCLVLFIANISFCNAARYDQIPEGSFVDLLKASTPMDGMEYVPKWVKVATISPGLRDFRPMAGQAVVIDKGGRPLDRHFQVKAAEFTCICFYSYYFPGWEVFIDGKPSKIHFENSYGLILFSVPVGQHQVRVHFGTTPVRRISEAVSLIFLFLITVVIIYRKRVDEWLQG
ncbi:MAG: hypothetical protein HQL24_09775 [Candidatus Omnitrophica bacterium]|nr:hypothetical protein [Candidatus Omnitrophota bacterium]